MTCSEFETALVEIARRRPVDAELGAPAQAHAATCPSCQRRLDDERLVTEQLSALRSSLNAVRAPDALGETLVAAFRGRRADAPVTAASGPPFPRWWLGAAAAVLLAAVSVGAGRWLATTGSPTVSSAPGRVDVEPAAPAPRVPPAAPGTEARTETTPEGGTGPVTTPPARAARGGRAVVAPPEAVDTERVTYTSLPAALPRWSDEPLVPVRLQLPYAALPALGVQVTKEQWGDTVPVEVLVGEDGIARGIRLVRYEAPDR